LSYNPFFSVLILKSPYNTVDKLVTAYGLVFTKTKAEKTFFCIAYFFYINNQTFTAGWVYLKLS